MAKLKWPRNWSRHLKMVYNLRLMKAELMDENTGFIGVLNEEIWQRFGKTWSKIRWTWCGKILSWTERSMVAGSWSTGQVNLVSKCRQHTSFSLESKRKKTLVTTFNKGYNFLLFTTWLIHFSSNILISPFSGTRSGVSVTRTKFARNYLRVKI